MGAGARDPELWLPVKTCLLGLGCKMNSEASLQQCLRQRKAIRQNPSLIAYQKAITELGGFVKNPSKILKVAILRNYTIEPLLLYLEGELLVDGHLPSFYLCDYSGMHSDVMENDSPFYKFDADFIMILTWLDDISPKLACNFFSMSLAEIEAERARVVNLLQRLIEGVRLRSQKPILINNFPISFKPIQGAFDRMDELGHYSTVQQLNADISSVLKNHKDTYLINFEGIFSNIGNQEALDKRGWYSARAPLGSKVMPSISRAISELIRGVTGKNKKCLILDCDNTLWGGIIGEDDIGGIKLGDDYPGNAFVDFQRYILQLQKRGVFLALCSKNNDADVVEVFAKHPSCVLKLEDFATRRVNWEDKASNIKSISEELNIGLDSIVFVDDSEFECDWVKQTLPEVEVVNLSGNPIHYVEELHSAEYFSTSIVSEEDRNRTAMFLGAKKSREQLINADTYEDYLADLNIQIEVNLNDHNSTPRIAQLSNKTNQFNLTTKRYSEAEINSKMASLESDVLSVRLYDNNTVYGLIGVVVLNYENDIASIESFFMSCRALGRGVEQALLSEIFDLSVSKKKDKIIGTFIPTKKNAMVKDFFQKHSFLPVKLNGDEKTFNWIYKILPNEKISYPNYIKLRTSNNGQ